MWKKLAFKQKKVLLFGTCFLAFCISYHLSFRNAIEAVQLNSKLNREDRKEQYSGATYSQVKSKNQFYKDILKLYQVSNDDRESRIWQAISGIALAKDIKIGFSPVFQALADTSAVKKNLFIHEFNFKGNYFDCISLLDSLSRTRGIGVIASLKLSVPKESLTDKDILLMNLKLSTLAH